MELVVGGEEEGGVGVFGEGVLGFWRFVGIEGDGDVVELEEGEEGGELVGVVEVGEGYVVGVW